MRATTLLLAGALFWSAAPAAMALPVKVYAARVTPGEFEAEAQIVNEDGDETETRLEVGYGFTRWWKAAAVAEIVDGPGTGPRAEAYSVENIIVLPRPKGLPFEWGLYAEYEVGARSGSPDVIELKGLFSRKAGHFDTRLNLIAEREVGAGAGDETEFEYAAQSRYALNDDFAIGLQASGALGDSEDFGKLSDRAHLFGPIVAGELEIPGTTGELELEAGYFFGLTDASPDDVVRVQVAWERKF